MKLLRIEGVNLAHCIDDTEDLSTRRGGSLMLLDAIDQIAVATEGELKKISTGASTGLFEIVGDGDKARAKIDELLAKPPYCHGTLMIDEIDAGDFRQGEIDAITQNRWRQMQSLSFAPLGLGASGKGICKVDQVRPATVEMTVKDEKQLVSASVNARRDYGSTAKRQFYPNLLGKQYADLEFSADFEAIASDPAVELTPKTLKGKIAVFYADGNGFGHVARDCKTAPDLRKWDEYLKGQRKEMLRAILDRARAEGRWQTKNGALCLETLLWGGDEVMFVVPGWCGLELAQLFFEQTDGMKYGGKELFHACGLVFCHQQAPISRIAKLARALADKGKEANRDADSLNWLVLESFDHTGADFDTYLEQRFETSLTWADLALDPAAVNVLQKQFSSLKYELPRSALIQVTRTLASPEKVGADKTAALTNRARQQVANAGGTDKGKDGFKALWKALQGTEWTTSESSDKELRTWIKLAELWDYCPNWNKNGAEQ